MFPAPLILVLIILISPLCLIFDGPITYGLIAAAAAVLVTIIGVRIRPGEAEFLSPLIRRVAFVAAIPVLAFLFQLLPLGSLGLANPIWRSAAAALSRPVVESISIDPGATTICLVRYLSLAGLLLATAAVTIDRRRAGWVLYALTMVTTLAALIAFGLAGNIKLSADGRTMAVVAVTNASVLGIILATAAALQTLQRPASPSPRQDNPLLTLLAFVLCLVALATCALYVFQHATSGVYIALMFGLATLVVAIIIRRTQLDAWGYSAVAAVVVVIVIAALALRLGDRTIDSTLVLSNATQSPLAALTRRILSETGWLGTGAGTFAAILPVYRDIDELTAGNVAPTAAAAIAIEMGKPFLWLTIIGSTALVVMLLRGAARRGRDSLYPAAGASCAVAIMLLAFNNHGVFNSLVLVIMAAIVGLAIAQSKSRSV